MLNNIGLPFCCRIAQVLYHKQRAIAQYFQYQFVYLANIQIERNAVL